MVGKKTSESPTQPPAQLLPDDVWAGGWDGGWAGGRAAYFICHLGYDIVSEGCRSHVAGVAVLAFEYSRAMLNYRWTFRQKVVEVEWRSRVAALRIVH